MTQSTSETLKLLSQRYSVRQFLDQAPDWDQVKQIVTTAAQAASSKNTQPWKLHLVRGRALEALRQDYLEAFDQAQPAKPDYTYAPHPLPEDWMALARECGFSLFEHKGIERHDREARQAHNRLNFEFFGAPGLFLLSTKSCSGLGNFLDCGLFLQNLMIGLDAEGYGSCPQFSAVSYPEILRKHCPEADEIFICGLAFGIPDHQAHVNQFRTTRRPIESWFYEHGDS